MITPALASIIGTAISTAGSFAGGMYQNYKQEQFYNNYMSPQARMAQMTQAGINPSAAAQGISGSPSANLSAAGPSGALSGLGDIVAALPQLTAEIDNIKSQTSKNQAEEEFFKSQTTGKNIENKFNFDTFVARVNALNLDNEQKKLTIDTLRPYAENAAEWYKINFDNLDEQANKIRKEISEIDEKIKNLSKEREVMDSQIGLNTASANELSARTALERQKKELIDSLGGEDVESAYVIARAKGDDKKADIIRNGVQDYVEAESKGAYNGDPVHREFNNAQDAREQLGSAITEAIESQKQLGIDYVNGRVTRAEYERKDKEYSKVIKELRNAKSSADRAFSSQSYKNGYHTWWQDNASSLINSAAHLGSAFIISGGMKGMNAAKVGKASYDRGFNDAFNYYGN